MRTAPNQVPNATKAIRGSMMRRVMRNGMVGVIGERKRATWAPMETAERERHIVVMRTERKAMKEYPPAREMMALDLETGGVL